MLEAPLAFSRDRVIDPLAPVHALATRFERAAFLERVQHGVDHAFTEADGLARDEAHRFDDFVAVHLATAQHSQDEQLRHAGQKWWIRLRHSQEDRPIFVYWPVRFGM